MRGKILWFAVAIALSIAAIAWFLWGVDWQLLGDELASVRVGWVALAAGLLLGEFAIRALRWKVLLRPLGRNARVIDLWAAQVIGAAVNTVLPARLGEVAKPVVAARRTGHPIVAVVATSVMERVYDLFGLVTILLLMVVVLPAEGSAEGELVTRLKLYGGLAGAAAIVAMSIFFFLATRKVAARGIFERIVGLAPAPVGRPFLSLFDGFVAGLGNARDARGLWQAGLLSIWMWANGALAIFMLFKAFDMDLPFGAACFVAVAIALAVVVPQAPGFIGVFHAVILKTMMLWGQPLAAGQGFALIFWAVSFVPVTAVGLLAIWREGLSLSSLREARAQFPSEPPGAPPHVEPRST